MKTVLIQDSGFVVDDWRGEMLDWQEVQSHQPKAAYGLEIPNTLDAEELQPHFNAASLIRIGFPSFADGRGFSRARHLRLLGYNGRLRAFGHIIADQYAMARRCGFDEIEIEQTLANRQPLEDWQFRANWQENNYQQRLQQSV